MEIRQLEAFAAVYAAGSVTAAGRLLDRSQPMVSRQIQDLENELGFTLFIRTRPQVTLTAEGEQFYEEVRNVLTGLQQLDTRSREIARGQARPLRIAATYALGASFVPAVIGRLERHEPVFEYKLHLDTMNATDVVQAVMDGKADVGVVSLPIDLARCHVHWSGQAVCVAALSMQHPLATRDVIRSAELGEHTVIALSNRSRLRHRMSTALLRPSTATQQRRHIETSTSLNALMLAREGVGVALVDPVTAACLRPDGVVYRPIEPPVPYVLGAISHRDRSLPEEAHRLIQALWDYANVHIPHFTAADDSGLPRMTTAPSTAQQILARQA